MLTDFITASERRQDARWARIDKLSGQGCGWSILAPTTTRTDEP
jgi:hypothetical protein